MIVISGALVLVALILLVIGLVSASLTFVYASIGVSVLSFIALLLGVLQRRKEDRGQETAPADETASEVVASDDLAVAPVRRTASAPATGGTVLVVAGRPRYHVEGCRYLAGRSADEVDVSRAVEEGFTACGVCKPDEALAGAAVAEAPELDVTEAPEPAEEAAAPQAPAAASGTRAAAKAPAKAAKKAAPAKAAVTKAPAKAAPAKAAVTKAPAKAASKATGASAPKRGGVIVIPDRGKFHKAECRYVRGASGTLELTRAQAVKQGYEPCGVCSS